MKYVGNFSEYIPKGVYEKLMSPQRVSRPFIELDDSKSESTYKINNDLLEIKVDLPTKVFGEIVEVWFTRLDPGDVITLHQDAFEYNDNNLVRYSMFLQDYKRGHIFLHDDHILCDYKTGDVFEFDDPYVWHAACNIGLEPRLTMQISSRKQLTQ
jgi:hypothetical protein